MESAEKMFSPGNSATVSVSDDDELEKKFVKRVTCGLSGIQRDEVEYSIKEMMYSTTREAFNRSRDGFEKFCKGECSDVCSKPCLGIFEYFQDNGESCSELWSNHGWWNYFTAGNTTLTRLNHIGTSLNVLLQAKPVLIECLLDFSETKSMLLTIY
ncbi:unnamed protein product [Phytophthora fragariaefolia]|uniref:Unnamed protein product n=1 Tax=Phytophthora fragariaefolia TaxID=1490495 RepID=A0A9W6YNP4_9STRA|nr:unnamed protein product [Phytophthora fragariaefolia]